LKQSIDAFLKPYKLNSTEQLLAAQNIMDFIASEDLKYHIINNLTIHHTYNDDLLIAKQLSEPDYNTVIDIVKAETLQWLIWYFSNLNLIALETKEDESFFGFWKNRVKLNNGRLHNMFENLPNQPTELIEYLVAEFNIPVSMQEQYFMQVLWQIKGWVGYFKWSNQFKDNPWVIHRAAVIDILAVWLSYEWFYWNKTSKKLPLKFITADTDNLCVNVAWQQYRVSKAGSIEISMTNSDLLFILIKAKELAEQSDLLQKINIKKTISATKPDAQFIFCIDVRSEGLRYQIEKIGRYHTYGYAGFFGFVYQLQQNSGRVTCQCPALIEPEIVVKVNNFKQSLVIRSSNLLLRVIDKLKSGLLSAFASYEMFGLGFLPKLLCKTYFSKSYIAVQDQFDISQIDIQQAAVGIKQFLQTIGLVQQFAETVVLIGHRAQTDNNPYQASFDCGACGGNAGDSNAIITCNLLNNNEVRRELNKLGIDIPVSTVFVAASHNTTTDQVYWYNAVTNSATTQKIVALQKQVEQASRALRIEREQRLPNTGRTAWQRAADWAEIMPELGLVNNKAFIVAPREFTMEQDFQQRVFLHSYNPQLDSDGAVLESIMLGPMLVAHWINMQYFFSTLFPDTYGSGNKAIHNIIPNLGVMEGNLSDLKTGLPIQSISYKQRWLHVPLRLQVILYAKQSHVDAILAKHQQLANLVAGDWIFLTVIQP
jgi:uncharacterized protein YbcC (UPF0753/DUF2309 family)